MRLHNTFLLTFYYPTLLIVHKLNKPIFILHIITFALIKINAVLSSSPSRTFISLLFNNSTVVILVCQSYLQEIFSQVSEILSYLQHLRFENIILVQVQTPYRRLQFCNH